MLQQHICNKCKLVRSGRGAPSTVPTSTINNFQTNRKHAKLAAAPEATAINKWLISMYDLSLVCRISVIANCVWQHMTTHMRRMRHQQKTGTGLLLRLVLAVSRRDMRQHSYNPSVATNGLVGPYTVQSNMTMNVLRCWNPLTPSGVKASGIDDGVTRGPEFPPLGSGIGSRVGVKVVYHSSYLCYHIIDYLLSSRWGRWYLHVFSNVPCPHVLTKRTNPLLKKS